MGPCHDDIMRRRMTGGRPSSYEIEVEARPPVAARGVTYTTTSLRMKLESLFADVPDAAVW